MPKISGGFLDKTDSLGDYRGRKIYISCKPVPGAVNTCGGKIKPRRAGQEDSAGPRRGTRTRTRSETRPDQERDRKTDPDRLHRQEADQDRREKLRQPGGKDRPPAAPEGVLCARCSLLITGYIRPLPPPPASRARPGPDRRTGTGPDRPSRATKPRPRKIQHIRAQARIKPRARP